MRASQVLRMLFEEAVSTVSAERAIARCAVLPPVAGRTVMVAVGKGAAAMASAAIARFGPPDAGLVVTRRGHAEGHRLPATITLIEAGHPMPDAASVAAAQQALALVRPLDPSDRVLMLVSGGGSALLALPVPGVTLTDKQALSLALLRSGATIAEINCVRKHLSAIKGGRLAIAAAPAPVVTLVISDVPGDDPSFVASGPTVADTTTLADAREIVARYRIDLPANLVAALDDPANETPPADTLGLAGGDVRVIATARHALDAAGRLATGLGYTVHDLGDHLQTEAHALGTAHAALARRIALRGGAHVILSGGETTVRVTNPDGRGGRNLEYLLGLALALDGHPRIHAIACDTDGIDGTEDNAGAIIAPDTLPRAAAPGLDPAAMLATNRSHDFFAALGDLVVTGPTRTNVNDFRAILIEAER